MNTYEYLDFGAKVRRHSSSNYKVDHLQDINLNRWSSTATKLGNCNEPLMVLNGIELHQLLGESPIVQTAKIGRLQWAGHVVGISAYSPVKMILDTDFHQLIDDRLVKIENHTDGID